ncbi:hypothetical protein SRABI96_02221 [Peribacillus sp. Bi96]|uniref:hypothetical protein n=1 Tax=Peribacillus sp. Bi96 TaxID=2884273 RepID=UPI001D8113AB|nr:hypothetical protein [Peribacillus sp. Bi96]CAH0213288.1 hypothetical protein SRABI96_02221 [Peribacillus sp. Bi96]
MLVFFMFVLFVLNIFTIFAIVILYLRQNRLSKLEKDQKAIIGEMEQLLSGYLMEMKEDNETLVQAFTNSVAMKSGVDTNEQEHGPLYETMGEKEVKQEQNMMQGHHEGRRVTFKKQAINAYKKMPEEQEYNTLPVIDEDKLELSAAAISPSFEGNSTGKEFADMLQASLNERSLDEQVKMLADQGHSIKEIAKKLNRGQTEIELLLKFRMNR